MDGFYLIIGNISSWCGTDKLIIFMEERESDWAWEEMREQRLNLYTVQEVLLNLATGA